MRVKMASRPKPHQSRAPKTPSLAALPVHVAHRRTHALTHSRTGRCMCLVQSCSLQSLSLSLHKRHAAVVYGLHMC